MTEDQEPGSGCLRGVSLLLGWIVMVVYAVQLGSVKAVVVTTAVGAVVLPLAFVAVRFFEIQQH